MSSIADPQTLLLSVQRALLGNVHPELRQVSIESDHDRQVVRLRFEYDGNPSAPAWESLSCAAAEVIADFPRPWGLDEQHIDAALPTELAPLELVAYRRAEPEHEA